MNTQHTPGPWKIADGSTLGLYDMVRNGMIYPDDIEIEAALQRIRARMEMHDELLAFVQSIANCVKCSECEHPEHVEHLPDTIDSRIDAARKLAAKAKGEKV